MLAAFQQAFADLVASPTMCQLLRDGESVLVPYELTDLEAHRLTKMVAQREMEANCIVYRSNRLTPIVLNFPETCRLLGTGLRPLIDQFWETHPTEQFVHFLLEAQRFHRFATEQFDRLPPEVDCAALARSLAHEGEVVARRLSNV
jgi:hypothetical protein